MPRYRSILVRCWNGNVSKWAGWLGLLTQAARVGGIGNGGGRVSIAIKDVKRRAQEIKRSKPLMEWPDESR